MKKKIALVVFIIICLIGGLTLFIVFKPKTHKVEFINDKDIKVVKVKDGDIVDEPTDPIKKGYEFLGWFKDKEIFDFDTKITKYIKLTAKWKKIEEKKDNQYAVTFKSDDEIVTTKNVDKNSVVDEPKTPTKEGYIFLGWYNGDKLYDFNSKVESDMELIAKWKKESKETNDNKQSSKKQIRYDVIFGSNGGTTVDSKSVLENQTVGKPTDPTRENYIFMYWELNGQRFDFSTKITKSITLKARWLENNEEKTYTYSWDYIDKVTPIDVIVTVYENGNKIKVKGIYRAKDGKKICGESAVMNNKYAKDASELIVELTNGKKVTAKKIS